MNFCFLKDKKNIPEYKQNFNKSIYYHLWIPAGP
jgi:hypothetical protein